MKKILINISLILLSLPTFCQTQKMVKLDNVVSIQLPEDYHKIDTLGQQSYTARTQYGYVIVSRLPNPETNGVLKKERELNSIFKEYIHKTQASLSNGSIVNDHDTIINKLEFRDFMVRTDTGSGVQYRKYRILYTQPVTYSFQYLYDEARQDVAAKEMNAFFNNIKSPPDLDGTDQYLTFGKWQGVSRNSIILIVVGVAIIAFVIIMVKRKRRQDKLLNDFTG